MAPDLGSAGGSILTVDRATKDFVGLRAVDHVSFQVRQGEILGLIGPNGSGKTTLINLITGQLAVSDGRIRIDHTDITDWPPHRIARRGIARTFQTVHLFSALTVRENLEVAAVGAGMSRRRGREQAAAISRQFGLEEMAHVRAGTVAFGLQRRVEVARALAMRPRFLLLDEPAAGLNEAECDGLLSLLASIRQQIGCGLLVVDHDMRLIMRLCDRIHVLNHGQTIAEGTAEDVRADPDVVEAYLGSSQEE